MSNRITLAGIVNSTLEFSHEVYGEKFYKFMISVERKSGTKDVLQCLVSDAFSGNVELGSKISINGEIRNYNQHIGEKSHSIIYVFVKEVLPYDGKDRNEVELNGFICKDTTYRETPLGRQICDFILAANRRNFKSDYVPCIAWGRNAIRASIFDIGDNVELTGRLQSREYTKKYEDGTEEVKTAYEVSVRTVNVINKEKKGDE